MFRSLFLSLTLALTQIGPGVMMSLTVPLRQMRPLLEAVLSPVHHREIRAPRADRLAVLLRHDAGSLGEVS